MNDRPPQSTLRKLRDHVFQPGTVAVLLGIGAVLALAAPYDTDELLRLVPRFAYWLALVTGTYSAGFVVSDLIRGRFGGRWPLPVLIAVVALATGMAVALMVLLLNLAVFAYWPEATELPLFFLNIFGIAAIITVVLQIVETQAEEADDRPPPLLDRLPLDKRGPLLALSVEDHYVRIITTRGEEVVLMRLADAMREVGQTPGLQVHRSHWVATGGVTSARREGDRAILTLSNGQEIPVSRRYVPDIREAGLLPR